MSHALLIARNEYRNVLQPYRGGRLARDAARKIARLLHHCPDHNPIIGLLGTDDPTHSTDVALAEFGIVIIADGNLLRAVPAPAAAPAIVTEAELLEELSGAA